MLPDIFDDGMSEEAPEEMPEEVPKEVSEEVKDEAPSEEAEEVTETVLLSPVLPEKAKLDTPDEVDADGIEQAVAPRSENANIIKRIFLMSFTYPH